MANFPVVRASSPTEDGAAFRYLSTNKSDRGIQFKVTLPTKTLQGYHFINFYTGLGNFECGISACPSKFGHNNWRVFYRNHGDDDKHPTMTFKDGETVLLKLFLDDSTGKVRFQVNSQDMKITDIGDTFTNQNGFYPRVVAGAAQGKGEGSNWITKHKTINMYEIQNKNAAKVWSTLTNGSPEYVNINLQGEPKHKAAKVTGNNYKVSLVETLV